MATTIGSLDLNAFSDLYSDSTQYFWFESNASATYGAGAHVTLVPDTTFISNPTGQNILMNTDGFSIRNGLLPMMTLDNDSLDFNVVDTTAGTYTTTATFTSTGAQIGQSSGAHSVIDANGQRFYGGSDGTTQLANIGYGEGAAQSGTAIAPYCTFGVRKTTTTAYSSSSTYYVGDMCVYDGKVYVCVSDITTPESWNANHWVYYIGNYSMAEGYNTTASGYVSHAEGHSTAANGNFSHSEGYYTTASGYVSHAEGYATKAQGAHSHAEGYTTIASEPTAHAEGYGTTASYDSAHAEGMLTVASGAYSHAEGVDTVASGTSSHAQNRGTIASKTAQTSLGTYNIEDKSATTTHPNGVASYGQYALILGNGTADNARSNALTVDWNGQIGSPTTAVASTTITTFTSGWAVYTADQKITLRRYGRVVSLTGALKNTVSKTLNTTDTAIFTLPTDWREYWPKQLMSCVGHGSGANKFLFRVHPNDSDYPGVVTFARYTNGTSYSSIASGAWFPFHVTWIA